LGADFDARRRAGRWISVARRCWTGTVEPFEGRFYRLAEAISVARLPHATYRSDRRDVPVCAGAAGRIGDGWLAQYSLDDLRKAESPMGWRCCAKAGTRQDDRRRARRFRIVVRVTGADRKLDVLATRLESLAGAVRPSWSWDVDWDTDEGPPKGFDILRSAVA